MLAALAGVTKGRPAAGRQGSISEGSVSVGEPHMRMSPRTPKGAAPSVPDISTPQIHAPRSAAALGTASTPGRDIPFARMFDPGALQPIWWRRGRRSDALLPVMVPWCSRRLKRAWPCRRGVSG